MQRAQFREPLSEPPTSDLHLLDQPSAPVDMDWDEDEPITQHESVQALPNVPNFDNGGLGSTPPELGDDDRTRQVYVGGTFSGVVPRGSGIQAPIQPSIQPPNDNVVRAPVATQASEPTAPTAYTPAAAEQVTTAPPLAPHASYGLIVAVVATIVAVISVGLMATRSSQPASVHLSTLPNDAEVRVDDVPIRLERSPYVIGDLEPEVVHQLDVRSPGYTSWSTRITLQPGQVLKLPRVALVPIAKAAEPVIAEPGTGRGPWSWSPPGPPTALMRPTPCSGGRRASRSRMPSRARRSCQAEPQKKATRAQSTPRNQRARGNAGATEGGAGSPTEREGILRINSRPGAGGGRWTGQSATRRR